MSEQRPFGHLSWQHLFLEAGLCAFISPPKDKNNFFVNAAAVLLASLTGFTGNERSKKLQR